MYGGKNTCITLASWARELRSTRYQFIFSLFVQIPPVGKRGKNTTGFSFYKPSPWVFVKKMYVLVCNFTNPNGEWQWLLYDRVATSVLYTRLFTYDGVLCLVSMYFIMCGIADRLLVVDWSLTGLGLIAVTLEE